MKCFLILMLMCGVGYAEPKVLWRADVGYGFSGIVVRDDRLYTAGSKDEMDSVYCFEPYTGAPYWHNTHHCAFEPFTHEGDGSATTPLLAGDFLFYVDRGGLLMQMELWEGRLMGSNQCPEKPPSWGYGASPVVAGGHIVALPTYSTPVGNFIIDKDGLKRVDYATSKILWHSDWKTQFDCNIPSPVLYETSVFATSFYGHECAMLDQDDGAVVWQNKNLCSQVSTPIVIEDKIYGLNGKVFGGDSGVTSFVCIDADTGELLTSDPSIVVGGMTQSNGKLYILTSTGELLIGPEFKHGNQILGGQCLTPPCVTAKRIYCRNNRGNLVCLSNPK